MKRILLGLTCTAILLGLAAYSNASQEAADASAILRIISTVEGQEVVFEGKYFGMADSDVRGVVEARQTPFEVKVEAAEFFALFHKLEGEAGLKVQLFTPGASAEATGDVVMVMRQGEGVMSTML